MIVIEKLQKMNDLMQEQYEIMQGMDGTDLSTGEDIEALLSMLEITNKLKAEVSRWIQDIKTAKAES